MEVFRNNSGGWGPPELFQRLPVIFIGYTYIDISLVAVERQLYTFKNFRIKFLRTGWKPVANTVSIL